MTCKTCNNECIRFPACGCADPFASRWPSCVSNCNCASKTEATKTDSTAPSSCHFHPECGCADADRCPMHPATR